MIIQVTAKNVGFVFFGTQCRVNAIWSGKTLPKVRYFNQSNGFGTLHFFDFSRWRPSAILDFKNVKILLDKGILAWLSV